MVCPDAHSEEELLQFREAYEAAGIWHFVDDRHGVMSADATEVMAAFGVSASSLGGELESWISGIHARHQEGGGWSYEAVGCAVPRRCPFTCAIASGETITQVAYSSVKCVALESGGLDHRPEHCPSGTPASFCHSQLEFDLHPDKFWTEECRFFDPQRSGSCKKLVQVPRVCPFAHSPTTRQRGTFCSAFLCGLLVLGGRR
jgi:hypothetical protein